MRDRGGGGVAGEQKEDTVDDHRFLDRYYVPFLRPGKNSPPGSEAPSRRSSPSPSPCRRRQPEGGREGGRGARDREETRHLFARDAANILLNARRVRRIYQFIPAFVLLPFSFPPSLHRALRSAPVGLYLVLVNPREYPRRERRMDLGCRRDYPKTVEFLFFPSLSSRKH